MQLEFVVNTSGISILLSPETVMEEEMLKQVMKQDNELQEIRTAVTVLAKTFKNGLLIGKKTPSKRDDKPLTDGLGGPLFEKKDDDSQEKAV